MELGNYWEFSVLNDNDQTLLIMEKINYQGAEYYRFDNPEKTAETFPIVVREDAPGVFISYYIPSSVSGVSISDGTIKNIDISGEINQSWTSSLTLQISGVASGQMVYTHQGKVTSKNASETINGVTYKDVVKHELTQTISNSITGITQTIIHIDWLAKGIGPIKQQSIFDEEVVTYELKQYVLNQ